MLDEPTRDFASWQQFHLDAAATMALLVWIPAECRSVANFWHAFHAIYAGQVGRPSDARWGDKTPFNVARLPNIVVIFPQARFVFMIRDVFDTAYWYGSMPMLRRDGQFIGGAERWVYANSMILEFSERYPTQTLLVRYEDLTGSPDREMARVLRHLEIPLPEAGAVNALEARDIAARPHLGNVLGAVSPDFVDRGRANLEPAVKESIAAIAAPLQIHLGYESTGANRFPVLGS